MEFGNESVPIDSTLEISSKVNELEQTPFIVDTTGVLSHGSDLTTGIPVTSDNTSAEDILFYKDENGLVYFAEDSNNIVFLQQDQDLSQFIADGNYQQVVVSEANDHGIILTDGNGYQTVVTGTSNDQNVAIVNNNEYQIVVSESNDQATPTIYNSPQTAINEQNELTANNITNHAIENSEIKYCEQEINTTFQYDDKILASENYVEETTILNNSEQGTECTQNSDLKASITTTEYPDATSGCNLPETATISNQNQETVQPEISISGSDNNDVIAHESVALENNQQEAVSISDGNSKLVTTLPNLETNMTNDNEHEILTAENNDQQLNTISGYDHSSAEIEKICLDTSTIRSDSNEKIITPSEHQIVVNPNNQNGDMTNSPNHDQEIIGHSNDSSHDINLNGTRSEGINLIDNDNNGEMTVLSKEQNLITISNDVGQKHDESQIIDRKTPCELSVPEISDPEPIKIDALHQEKDFNDSQDCVISKINNDVDNDPARPTVSTDDHKMKESLPVVKDPESHVIDEQTAMQDSDSQDTIEEIEYIVEEVIEFDDASQTEESETDSKAQDSVISNDDERLLSNYSGTLDLPRTNKLRIKEDILFSKSGVRKPLRTYERKNKSVVPQKLDNGVHGMQELSKRRSTFKDDGYSPDSSKSSPRTSHKPSPLGQRESVRVYGAPKKQPSSGSSLSDRVQRSPNKCKYDEVKLFEELEDHSPNHETNMSLHAQHIECMNLTEDSACIDLESILSPTKKKGRPPKMKSPEMKDTSKKDLQASYTETDSMLETDVSQTTPVSTTKKRRGRPPRAQHDIESTPHQLGELKTSSVQIRDSPTSHSILSESITDIVDQEVSVVDSPTPKKRGRKPKIASGLNSSVEESFSARTPISAVSLPNKRRGRPPKEISDRAIISVETSARAPRSSGADEHESSPAVPNVSSPAKKRRGRPPRVSLVPGPDPSTDQPVDSIIHTIEPNSHPVSDDTINVLGTDTHEIPTNDNNENVDNVRTLKRKRGRQSGALPDAGELLNASKTKESLEISAIKGMVTL
ncbi:hypothetical protein QAD02_000095 [Eretmocerus hayati]|uniref:Uncharacterized protein n=1 Tax=Eretmocerus hayati TaxID=131215 RepID=A0ACC2ND40_9HYME|nr:hypothetical protein QAD02_000095 [Eretmocerus hayati]